MKILKKLLSGDKTLNTLSVDELLELREDASTPEYLISEIDSEMKVRTPINQKNIENTAHKVAVERIITFLLKVDDGSSVRREMDVILKDQELRGGFDCEKSYLKGGRDLSRYIIHKLKENKND